MGNFFFNKGFNPDVLQTYSIEHAAGRFHQTGRWIARLWFEGNAFGNDSPQVFEGHKIPVLLSVPKGAGGSKHRSFYP